MQRILVGLWLCLSVGISAPALASDDVVMEFDTMVGINGGYLGNANPIRGVDGGGAPWVLDRAKGELDSAGNLEVEIEGLIIPNLGFNPAPFFRVLLSCLSVDVNDIPNTVNLLSDIDPDVMQGDPRNGDARFELQFDLPQPCIAPIVFVTHPDGRWFAVSGSGTLAP